MKLFPAISRRQPLLPAAASLYQNKCFAAAFTKTFPSSAVNYPECTARSQIRSPSPPSSVWPTCSQTVQRRWDGGRDAAVMLQFLNWSQWGGSDCSSAEGWVSTHTHKQTNTGSFKCVVLWRAVTVSDVLEFGLMRRQALLFMSSECICRYSFVWMSIKCFVVDAYDRMGFMI